MSFESSEFAELFNELVTWRAFQGIANGYDGRVLGTPGKPVRARIEQGAKVVTDAREASRGQAVTSMARLLLMPAAEDGSPVTPSLNDEFVLPAGYVPQAPSVLRVDRQNDEGGLHHWVVSLA